MKNRLKRRLSFANVVAVIALFVALGGSVYAAHKISGKRIKRGSEPGNRLKNDSVTGKQVAESTLGTVPNADALAGAPASAYLTIGRSAQQNGACDPLDTSFVNCVTVTLNLPHAGRVLLVGVGVGVDQGGIGAEGSCRFGADNNVVSGSTISVYARPQPDNEDFSLTAVSEPLGPGSHSLQLACNEEPTGSGIRFDETHISAVMLGSG
jgi:hypothetical protein